MAILVLNQSEVEQLLDMEGCIEAMAEVLASLARGELYQPLRVIAFPPGETSGIGLMPAHRSGASAAYALKTICLFPDNPERGLDAHQGTVTLFSGETGEVRALMNASAITAIRTAAVSGVATRLLAREDARELAVLGAGVQGRSHIEAMRAVKPWARIRVASRTLAHSQALADETGAEAVETAEEAVRGADVVVTATSAREPVLRREWLKPGAHVNAVGASQPSAREVDTATVADSSVFVDSRESVRNEAGEFILAIKEGAISGEDHIRAELGEVLAGTRPGRADDGELTLFRSLGVAAEDLAAAQLAVENARERGIGFEVEL
jgi:ornithine cyclodeaminase/alanine dehydrogenase-like protein (mu-crystallin family)